MNDKRLPDAIIGRLSRVRTLESQLEDRLEELRTDTAIDRAPGESFKRLLALAASHRLTLDEFPGLRGDELNRLKQTDVHRDGVPALSAQRSYPRNAYSGCMDDVAGTRPD